MTSAQCARLHCCRCGICCLCTAWAELCKLAATQHSPATFLSHETCVLLKLRVVNPSACTAPQERGIRCACERCSEPLHTSTDRYLEGVWCLQCTIDVLVAVSAAGVRASQRLHLCACCAPQTACCLSPDIGLSLLPCLASGLQVPPNTSMAEAAATKFAEQVSCWFAAVSHSAMGRVGHCKLAAAYSPAAPFRCPRVAPHAPSAMSLRDPADG